MDSEIDKDIIIKQQQEEILRLKQKVKKKKEKKKINPYKILEIPKKYDQNMLKKCYMKKALIMHPDRGGDEEEFKLLGLSYKILLKKLEEKNQSHDYNELKNNHKEFIQENENNSSQKLEVDNFNINTFNEIYDEYKLKDNFKDTGYGNWLKSKDNSNNENTKLKDNFTTDKFNSEFNKAKKKKSSKELTVNEPMELISMRNQDSLELLGRSKVKNYSGSVNGLGYRDLKDAYENSTLIDITKVNIKDRDTNILYYEKNRENISYEMNESELLNYNKNILKTNKMEEDRINRLRKQDDMINKQYELIHQRLLN